MLLPAEMLEFGYPREGFFIRIIDGGHRLKLLLRQMAMFKTQRAVWQAIPFCRHQLIQHTGIDQWTVERHTIQHHLLLLPIQSDTLHHGGRQPHVNQWVCEHALKHGGIACGRHRLPGIGEVAIIPTYHHGHSRRHLGGDLVWRNPPLFAGVVDEGFLIDEISQFTQQGMRLFA